MKTIDPGFVIESKINGKGILKHIERVGRTCYKSEDAITEDSCEKFVAGLIARGHEAIIEHYNVTVRFICNRGVSHEIVRHRVASYAQESQRYCNYSLNKFENSVTFINAQGGMAYDTKMEDLSLQSIYAILSEWEQALKDAESHYFKLLELGATAQMARDVLPNATKTELVVTMNLREWRHFLKLRTDFSAHPQMREITIPLLAEFKRKIPVVFDDITV